MIRRMHHSPPPLLQGEARRGSSTVELALVMPIFVIFLSAMLEFGHFFLVTHTLNAAARKGAHYGSFENITNSQVTARVQQIVSAAFTRTSPTITISDASVFDSANLNASTVDYSTLPPINLPDIEETDLFMVQVSVAYNDVCLLPPFWLHNKQIVGRAVMRHE